MVHRVGLMTRSRFSQPRGCQVPLGVRLIMSAAALAGLFAMHGMSDHGSSHFAHAPIGTAEMAMSHAKHVADEVSNVTEVASTFDKTLAQGSPSMGMAGLCLAVLAGAIIGGLLSRPHRGVVLTRHLPLPPVSALPPGCRDRDPPCLFELSVLRT